MLAVDAVRKQMDLHPATLGDADWGKAITAAGRQLWHDNRLMRLLAGRLAYSVEEAARITGLSRDLLYNQMRQGKLAYLKVGRRRLITRQDLEAFLGKAS